MTVKTAGGSEGEEPAGPYEIQTGVSTVNQNWMEATAIYLDADVVSHTRAAGTNEFTVVLKEQKESIGLGMDLLTYKQNQVVAWNPTVSVNGSVVGTITASETGVAGTDGTNGAWPAIWSGSTVAPVWNNGKADITVTLTMGSNTNTYVLHLEVESSGDDEVPAGLYEIQTGVSTVNQNWMEATAIYLDADVVSHTRTAGTNEFTVVLKEQKDSIGLGMDLLTYKQNQVVSWNPTVSVNGSVVGTITAAETGVAGTDGTNGAWPAIWSGGTVDPVWNNGKTDVTVALTMGDNTNTYVLHLTIGSGDEGDQGGSDDGGGSGDGGNAEFYSIETGVTSVKSGYLDATAIRLGADVKYYTSSDNKYTVVLATDFDTSASIPLELELLAYDKAQYASNLTISGVSGGKIAAADSGTEGAWPGASTGGSVTPNWSADGTATVVLFLKQGSNTTTYMLNLVIGKPVEGVTLNKTETVLEVESTVTLTAKISPENAVENAVVWSSSDDKIATVDENGKVTAVAVGNATITATVGEKSASCAVAVIAGGKTDVPTNDGFEDVHVLNEAYISTIAVTGAKPVAYKSVQTASKEMKVYIILEDGTPDDAALTLGFTPVSGHPSASATVSGENPASVMLTNGMAVYEVSTVNYSRQESHKYTIILRNGNDAPALKPDVSASVSHDLLFQETYSVDLNDIFSDLDGDDLEYSVTIGEETTKADVKYSYLPDSVGEHKLVFKATDGFEESATYTVTLNVTNSTETYTTTVKVPAAVTPKFYITKGVNDDGTDLLGDEITPVKGAVSSGFVAYTLTIPTNITRVSVRGTVGTTEWGGMAFDVAKDGTYTLRQVNAIINSKVTVDNVERVPTADEATFVVKYVAGGESFTAVSGGSFGYGSSGYLAYRYLLLAADNKLSYVYSAEPLGTLTDSYSANTGDSKTVTSDSAEPVDATMPLGTKAAFTITAPSGATVKMYQQVYGDYYSANLVPAFATVDNADGTKSYTFNNINSTCSYRVSMAGKITKAGYVPDPWMIEPGVNDHITVTWSASDPAPSYRGAYDSVATGGYSARVEDNILVNVNYRNNLLLDVNETFTLRSYRIWQIINSDTQNIMIEPDFHYNILSGEDVIDLIPAGNTNNAGNNRMIVKGVKEGIAVIEVSYDALALLGGTSDSALHVTPTPAMVFNAIDPNRTALIVVQVGASNTDISFGIHSNSTKAWDAEHDTVYFLEEKGQIKLTPTSNNSGTITEVAVSNDDGKNYTVLASANGTYTADIVPGNNVIRVTTDLGVVSYQMVRGAQISYEITERLKDSEGNIVSDGDGIIEAGESVAIAMSGISTPYNKMSGIYNPWSFLTVYQFNGGTASGGATAMYGYGNGSVLYLTIPEEATPGTVYTLTGGYTKPGTGFGNAGGGHREINGAVPPNLDADDSIEGANNIFPDLTITVGGKANVEEVIPVETVTLNPTTATVEAGKTVALTATIMPADATDKTITWTTSDSTIATVSDGYVTGVKVGKVTITATAGGKSASCVVTVTEAKPDEFGIPADEILGYVTVSFEDFGIRVAGEQIDAAYATPRGVIVPATKVPYKEFDTIASVTLRLLKAKGIVASYGGSEFSGFYLSAINGFGEFDAGQGSGWMITWNGWFINKGASEFHVKDGDVVKWQYTCQLGADIGDTSFYGSVTDVIKLINAIGTVTEDSGDKIKAARTAYDKLSDTDKKRVSNYKKLTDAEAAYEALMNEAVENVEKLIDAIGTVTLNSKSKIEAARKAYDALPTAQKLKVSNYSKLTDAESKLAELQKEEDKKAAQKVIDMIDDLDSNSETFEKDVEAAKKAYDALTVDQKKLVTNYSKLTDALKELASQEDKEAAEAVEKLINAIGTVTKDSEDKIKAAREAYDKLTDDQKALVENIAVLEAAEEKLAKLQEAAAGLDIYNTTGEYLENLGTPAPGSVGGEWMVVGLLRSDRKVKDIDAYYDAAVKFVQENIDENGRLHKAKSTENSRMILALTAMGKDVTNVGGHNLLTGLNDMEYVQKQGINGPIWALIALDSGNYPAPEGNVTREALIQVILDAQLADGGWALSGSVSDSDMTGMTLQALAPYYKTNGDVKKAVDTALIALSDMQAEDGSFVSIDGSSSESVAQVIAALSALGIDADSDPRFIKNGISAFDALCTFYVEGGGFKHTPDGKLDGMATEQSYYALAAYFRMLDGKTSLFNMTDVVDMGGDKVEEEPAETTPATTEPAPTEPAAPKVENKGNFPWWLVIVIVVLAGAIVVLVIVSKPKKRR